MLRPRKFARWPILEESNGGNTFGANRANVFCRGTKDCALFASEVIAIYPITPASPTGERDDDWAAQSSTRWYGQGRSN